MPDFHFGRTLAAFALIGFAAQPACAENTAITGFQIPNDGGFHHYGLNTIYGFTFTVNQAITVTELGFYDDTGIQLAANGGPNVGIYDSAGDLLISGAVDPAVGTASAFAYTSDLTASTPSGRTLMPGQVYTAAALDYYVNAVFNVADLTTDPAVNFGQNRITFDNSYSQTLKFPGGPDGNAGLGSFGPNFRFQLAAVPEPSQATLLGLGVLALFGLTQAGRKKRS